VNINPFFKEVVYVMKRAKPAAWDCEKCPLEQRFCPSRKKAGLAKIE